MNLTEVAQQMKTEATQQGYSQRTLKRSMKGLCLSLYEREHDVVLSISRPTALAPSEWEIKVCQEAFFRDDKDRFVFVIKGVREIFLYSTGAPADTGGYYVCPLCSSTAFTVKALYEYKGQNKGL